MANGNNKAVSNLINNEIDKVMSAFIKDAGKEHGRTIQLAVAVFNSTLDIAALIAGTSTYRDPKRVKAGKDTSAREQRRMALSEISPAFAQALEDSKAGKKSVFVLSTKASDVAAVSSAETMFLSALFVAYALDAMDATEVKTANSNRALLFKAKRFVATDGKIVERPMDKGNTHLSPMLKAGRNLAKINKLITVNASGPSGGEQSPVKTAAATAGTLSASIQKMTKMERADLSGETSAKEGLMSLILAFYADDGVIKLSDIANDIRTANLIKDKVTVEGRVVADLVKKPKAS